MTSKVPASSSWWGNFNLAAEQTKQWHIGPLTLGVRRLRNEWQIAYKRDDDFDENEASWEIKDAEQLPETPGNHSRYIFRKTTELLTITPLLADRAVISRPHTPFNMTAGEQATAYVSTPLWLELAVGSSPKKLLQEIAILRPSDTWFGPSTREGELCYASTTHCRLSLQELPQRIHRAITPVFIDNQANTTLSVERLNVPAPLLPLYLSSNGQFWTPKVTLTREKDGDMATLKIDNKPPKEAKGAVQLCKPRTSTGGHALIRAFNAVFS